MPKGLRQVVRDNLEKCRAAAIAAVEGYNRPGPRFRTAQYLVLIVISWTALCHAIFFQRGRRPWYRKKQTGKGKGIRYVKIDGEPKHWDLSECLGQLYGANNPPERRNLEFLLELRNKIEHRHLPALDSTLYGECQAALLNLEELLISEFGERHALGEQLAVSLQFTREIPEQKARAVKAMVSPGYKKVRDYVEKFRTELPEPVLKSMKYSFSIFLVPRTANRASTADAAVQFVRVDEASSQELERLDKLNVLIREKHIPIANLGLHRASQVLDELRPKIPFKVNMSSHTAAWRYFGVRPAGGDSHPERAHTEYCVYDEAHNDYLYTSAWIEKLAREFSDAERFAEITGQEARPK